MTQNPFDALGGDQPGGFDLQGLLQQAQPLAEQLQEGQARLAEARVEGSVGGGSVTVTLNGVGELEAISIRPGSFDGTSPDDLSDLGDLIVAAYRDAKSQADQLAGAALGPLAGGGLPGGAPGGGLPGGGFPGLGG
jgi:DNA-binding protein YbaB